MDTDSVEDEIINVTGNVDVHGRHLDLASFDSVRRFAREFNLTEERLDVLVNNAGIGGALHSYTDDKLQREMQINHFGPFLLTHLLIGKVLVRMKRF